MMRNEHDEARELIALGDAVSDAQQAWLRAHIDECEACRQYAETANGVVRYFAFACRWPPMPAWYEPRKCGCVSMPAGCGKRGNACGW